MLRTMERVATLLVIGTVLILLETVLPGMIAGLIGFGCLVAGVVADVVAPPPKIRVTIGATFGI